MKRDLQRLAGETFDVAVVGGGILGAWIARDAATRGLSVALVEKGDFGEATSASSLRIVHGGLRYLQQADLVRMRESIRERRTLLRVAPHLVRPLAFLVPAYGRLARGRLALRAALTLSDLVAFDRNRGLEPSRRLPAGRTISRSECLRLFPALPGSGLTGGAIYHDGQAHRAERLIVAILRGAARAGACLANHAAATGFVTDGGRIAGLTVTDALSGADLTVRARIVINAAGPWAQRVLGLPNGPGGGQETLCKGWNLVLRSAPPGACPGLAGDERLALGFPVRPGGDDLGVRENRGARFLFLTPCAGRPVLGTGYAAFTGDPDDRRPRPGEIAAFLSEIRAALPGWNLSEEEISSVPSGLLPAARAGAGGLVSLSRRDRLADHAAGGAPGLISACGVKYTTARRLAERAVDLAGRRLGRSLRACSTATQPVDGGDLGAPESFEREAEAGAPPALPAGTAARLASRYGTRYGEVLALALGDPRLAAPLSPATPVTGAEIVHAVREEMAMRLADAVRRRADLGPGGEDDAAALRAAASLMASELGWDAARILREIEAAREAGAWRGAGAGEAAR